MIRSCLICGVGGQGAVLASKLMAQAAALKGMDVKTSETIGMAQRGGSVTSHVRMNISSGSPLIPLGGADIVIAMEPSEAVRSLKYIKKEGYFIINPQAIKPVTSVLGGIEYNPFEILEYLKKCFPNYLIINPEEVSEASGSAKTLNTAMLGAACASGLLPLCREDFIKSFERILKKSILKMNIDAFDYGFMIKNP